MIIDYSTAALLAHCPEDLLENLCAARICLQPRQLLASADRSQELFAAAFPRHGIDDETTLLARKGTQGHRAVRSVWRCKHRRQQNEAAEGAFKKAIEVDPNYADAYYQQALVLMNKVALDKDGKMIAPPGTIEALQKYLALKPDGSNAEGAKAILEQLGTTVQTTFERPGAAKGKQPANPKKGK